MNKGETAVGCCPRYADQHRFQSSVERSNSCFHSGFVCGGNTAQTCSRVVLSGQTVPVITCSEGSSQGYTYLSLPVTETTTGVSSSASRVGVYAITSFEVLAPMIEIRWQSSDLPTTSSNSASSDSGLSTGAKAAIGVVIPVAVIAILVGIFFFWRRKIRKLGPSTWPASSTTSAGQSGVQQSSGQQLPMEMPSYYKTRDNRGSYMSSPIELDGSPRPQELEGSKLKGTDNG